MFSLSYGKTFKMFSEGMKLALGRIHLSKNSKEEGSWRREKKTPHGLKEEMGRE